MNTGGKSTNGLKSNIVINKEIKYACELNGLNTNYLKLYSKYFIKIFEFLTLLSGKSVKWLKTWHNILIMNTYFLVFQK